MAKGPAGYARFLEQLVRELPELSQRDPELADRLHIVQSLSDDWMIKIPHPLMSSLRLAFRQNKISKDPASKTLNIECTPKRNYVVGEAAVRRTWAASGLNGELGIDGSGFFFQNVWGYGSETDNLVYDQHLADNLRNWAIDAMYVAIRIVEGLQPSGGESSESPRSVDYQPVVSRHRHRLALLSEGVLEDEIIECWDELDWGADLTYIDRQVHCGNVGRLDILAKNSETDAYVAIELKKDKADDEVFGQLARYMGWLKDNRAAHEGVEVEGIVVAAEITPKLRSAVASHPGVCAVQYRVTVTLDPLRG